MTFLSSGGTSVGYFQLEGNSQIVAGLNGSTGFGIVENSETSSIAALATLTIDGSGSYSFNGTLRDHNSGTAVLALTMSGGGTQVLSGTNTYTGGTTVASGELIVSNNKGLADGSSLTVGGSWPAPAAVVPDSSNAEASSVATSPVPEPGPLSLFAALLATWLTYRRFRTVRVSAF
jgi:autotransporter-associated beta strand protein